MMNDERWLPIPEAPDYSISNHGQVKGSDGKILTIDSGRVRISRLGVSLRFNVERTKRKLFPETLESAMNTEGEIWKHIPDSPGYELSNHARVRRAEKSVAHGQFGATRILNAKILKVSRNNGYLVAYIGEKPFYIEKALFALFPELTPQKNSLLGEEWRDIKGYEGLYQVSNLGRIHSLPRLIDDGRGRNRHIRQRTRKLNCTGNGYPKVELAKDGKSETMLLHRIVAEAFLPNPHGFDCVHHKDEDKSNARVDNLEWISRAGNVRDWFDARPHRVDAELIGRIAIEIAAGKSPAEILTSLPRRRKRTKNRLGV